ncbi:MAG: immunoglobulin domain-containing protein, partial [Eubacteriaceae bacterium]|nr:immunoglobulin domain-containing protein [Eubacteriaceae bacterium]
MKAKSKVLLGLVVLLAMMIFAAPAMAQSTEGVDAISTNADQITVETNSADSYTFIENTSERVDISVTAIGGTEPYSYQWYKNGEVLKWSTYNKTFFYAHPENAGTYKCVVTDVNGNRGESKTINITVKPSPHIYIKEAAVCGLAKTHFPSGQVNLNKDKTKEDLTL